MSPRRDSPSRTMQDSEDFRRELACLPDSAVGEPRRVVEAETRPGVRPGGAKLPKGTFLPQAADVHSRQAEVVDVLGTTSKRRLRSERTPAFEAAVV